MKKWFEVVSGPVYWKEPVVEYLPGVWDGPVEEGRDWCLVWARSRRDAVKAAVRRWQRRCKGGLYGCCYPHQQRADRLNPFAGVKAYPVVPGGEE